MAQQDFSTWGYRAEVGLWIQTQEGKPQAACLPLPSLGSGKGTGDFSISSSNIFPPAADINLGVYRKIHTT